MRRHRSHPCSTKIQTPNERCIQGKARGWCQLEGSDYPLCPLTRMGGGGAHCAPPPPQMHFLKYLKNALSCRLETFWQFKWTHFQNKKIFSTASPPLVTIATSKVDACLNNTFRQLSCPKLIWTRRLLLFQWRVSSVESVVKIWAW